MRSFPIFHILLVLIALMLVQPVLAADPPGDEEKQIVWPKDVQEALRALKLAEERAHREFENKLFALRAPALEKIKAAQDRVTKEGNLEGALALKRLGDKISAGTAVPVDLVRKDILGNPIGATIESVKFGYGEKWKDVTSFMATKVRGGKLEFDSANAWQLKEVGDPVPGGFKTWVITYREAGVLKTKVYNQNEKIIFPIPAEDQVQNSR